MWIREISDQEMAMLGATPSTTSTGTRSPELAAKVNLILKTDLPITSAEIKQGALLDPEVIKALENPKERPAILGRMDKGAVVESIKDDEVLFNKKVNKPAKDSENGVIDGMIASGIRSARVQIRVLTVVLKVLEKINTIELSHVKKMTVALAKGKWKKAANNFKNALLDVAGAALYWSANTLSGGVVGTIMGASKSVIKKVIKRLRLRYNKRCGGAASKWLDPDKGKVGDFSDVGKADRENGICERAKGEPKWIDTGFRPYIWRGGLGSTPWNYTRIGISKNKRCLKELLEKRKKRGDKAPPKFKGGGKNTLDMRPPSAFRDRVSEEAAHGDR